jgi:hypothetical protein
MRHSTGIVRALCFSAIFAFVPIAPTIRSNEAVHSKQETKSDSSRTGEHQFALLVGVNEYVNPEWNTLHAPGNDVGLMKTLLIRRYGFTDDRSHMFTLIGKAATRKAIEDSFRSQLIANAKRFPDATLLFYYSGHGSLTNDGLQETIVPSDGRTEGVFDITDDDLSDLFDELLKYATKDTRVVFVFDSCHSGTIIKSVDGSLRAKEIPPDPRPQPNAQVPRKKGIVSKDVGTGVLVRNDAFVALAGSYSYESAYEDCLPDPDRVGGFKLPDCQVGPQGKRKPYSLFTYYLTQTLENSPNLRYFQAIERISGAVSSRARQHPNVEGDTNRLVFGISADREDAYLSIIGPIAGKTFAINGGSVLGLQEGTFLALYQPTAVKLTGEERKICNARVSKAEDFTATAEVPEALKNPIPPNAKVVVVTPYFGGGRLRVELFANQDKTALTDDDKRFIAVTTTILKDSPLIQVVADQTSANGSSSPWDIGLQKGFVSKDGVLCKDSRNPCAKDVSPSFYLVTPDRNEPLYGFYVRSTADDAPNKVMAMLISRARQQNLRAVTNAGSSIAGQVKLDMITVEAASGPDGKLTITGEKQLPDGESPDLAVGQRFRLKVENNSDTDLNVVVADIGTSGSILLLTPRGVGITVSAHTAYTTHEVFKLGPPTGLETFKLIAYKIPDDDQPLPKFAVLEQKGNISITPKGIRSPLEWLFTQAIGGLSKDASLDSDLDISTWTVGSVDAHIH